VFSSQSSLYQPGLSLRPEDWYNTSAGSPDMGPQVSFGFLTCYGPGPFHSALLSRAQVAANLVTELGSGLVASRACA
jgi:hypothetical protein